MYSSIEYWKWRQEKDLLSDLELIRAAEQDERIEQLGKRLKPPDKPISREELREKHNTLVRGYAEAKQKQDIQHEKERLTLQRYVDEHADCQTCSVCMEKLRSLPPPPNTTINTQQKVLSLVD